MQCLMHSNHKDLARTSTNPHNQKIFVISINKIAISLIPVSPLILRVFFAFVNRRNLEKYTCKLARVRFLLEIFLKICNSIGFEIV